MSKKKRKQLSPYHAQTLKNQKKKKNRKKKKEKERQRHCLEKKKKKLRCPKKEKTKQIKKATRQRVTGGRK